MNQQSKSPVLIYDGECDICLEWVNYWRKLGDDGIRFLPYQEVFREYPQIPVSEFEKAIKYIDLDGNIRSGAGATLALYQNQTGYSLLNWLYSRVPGFALVSESSYNFFSRHRGLLGHLTHLCWGKHHQPSTYTTVIQLFLRLLGCIYLAAFVSFGVQIVGLIGVEGVLPLDQYLEQARAHFGSKAYWHMPMLFWFAINDTILISSCFIGAFLSCLLIFGFFQRTALVLLYLLYLSLFYAGQTFMTFQWDLLLIETGFLAIFLPTGSKVIIWLFRWLVFRFMFMGGLVKIISRDPTWDNLTALNYHFETQPLPTIFAWYAHHLPEFLLASGVALTLITELLLPFFIFTPRRFRMMAACCFIVFQSLIMLTGNYNFFNLLTITICLFLFDDAAIKSCLPSYLVSNMHSRGKTSVSRIFHYAVIPLTFIILFSSLEQIYNRTIAVGSSPSLLSKTIAPWLIVQNYGPFAVMTTIRHEIIIEGSDDGQTWKEYSFKYKPGALSDGLRWATPHQPRLDWQMWFAALSQPEHNPWFRNLLYRLLSNSGPVVGLLAVNPFSESPPDFIRARFYEYHFSSPAHRKTTGDWWTRKFITEYYPPIRLSIIPGN